ncbi:CIS tube protein [Hymenobacter cellulosivorans]|uniref:LysM domain-containing protein n=1 Tax=Hymenobacter cellulosivorans TaxID=2932249 RepID=A0ABY4F6B7_9BACT|nr:hypothetical protein [Hymenobacter cellulosivorans]UOQ52078.1 hypothetical protein MUN80_20235 [Hymenobacter cellulosivorans]
MTLVKLKIQAYKDPLFSMEASSYDALINPESLSHTQSINYSNNQGPGGLGPSPKFKNLDNGEVSFDLFLDSTGAIRPTGPGTSPNKVSKPREVKNEIKKLRDVVFDYHGKLHGPYYLQLLWGSFIFKCRLTKFKVDYTLFRPDGSPLRAKVSMTFISFTDPKTLAQQADKQSADLSHQHLVKSGDTLPLLCHQVYGSSEYYLQVARFNKLVHFRHLQPGTYLVFPRLTTRTDA